MTAQAGAVAFAWYLRTGHGDSIHFGTEPPECLLSHKWKPLYLTPPAAVSVEALEGLVAKWEARSRSAHPTDAMLINKHVRELQELIKERSNG